MQEQEVRLALVKESFPGDPIPVVDDSRALSREWTFDSYVQHQLSILSSNIQGGLSHSQKLRFGSEMLAGIRHGTLDHTLDTSWKDAIDAMTDALVIAFEARRRIGKAWVPVDKLWMLYDPCTTTMWRDAETSSRFQEFVKRKQEGERVEAQERRRIRVDRQRELLERSRARGRVGDLIDDVASLFASGLLIELGVAHQVESSAHPSGCDLDDWELLEGWSDTRPSSLSGLFAKWTPTPGGMHDKALGIAPLIRERLLKLLREEGRQCLREELLRSAGGRARDDSTRLPLEHLSLQRDILTPLRRMAEIPEHFIGAGTARGGVNYSRMPSRCRMIFGEKVFRRIDSKNYDAFLIEAAKTSLSKQLQVSSEGNAAKVNAGALAPHEVMLRAVDSEASSSPLGKIEAQLQWQALIDSCTQFTGKSKRLIIPMCDVSGSMYCRCGDGGKGTCLDVACALSLLLSDSLPADNPFYGKILTFSENPQFVDLRQDKKADLTVEAIEEAMTLNDIASLLPDLAGRVCTLKGAQWGGSTNFFGAMKRICDLAWENQLTPSGLELVVFSDMEFNQAQYGSAWDQKNMLEKIRKLFVNRFGQAAMACPPRIIFWNLRSSPSGSGVAKDAEENGVALLSGASAGMIRKYLSWDLSLDTPTGGKGHVAGENAKSNTNPTAAMCACLQDSVYKTLRLEKDLREWEVVVSEEEILRRAEKVRGENLELMHSSNSSALVAFFFEAVPGISARGLEDLLDAAFKENPLIALKLIFNLGSVRKRAAGKADRRNFQLALLWLWRNWPETYLLNIAPIASLTSLKELLNSAMFILYEDERERDPDGHALYSLAGQTESLANHQSKQRYRDNKARRKRARACRALLWADFARCEGKKLFGELRIKRDFCELKEKLCIDETNLKKNKIRLAKEDRDSGVHEELWEMKEWVASRRMARLAKKRSKRARYRRC